VIDQLRSLGMVIEERSVSNPSAPLPLAGKTFVFTGGLDRYSRDEAKQLVEERGGSVTSSVSKHTSFVVAGHDPGSKLDQARKLAIPILTEQEFADLVNR